MPENLHCPEDPDTVSSHAEVLCIPNTRTAGAPPRARWTDLTTSGLQKAGPPARRPMNPFIVACVAKPPAAKPGAPIHGLSLWRFTPATTSSMQEVQDADPHPCKEDAPGRPE